MTTYIKFNVYTICTSEIKQGLKGTKMSLTERQKKELNEAILDYLLSEGSGLSKTAAMFREEGKLDATTCSGKALLEKKWTSIVRLQKKVLDLESQLAAAKESAAAPKPGAGLADSENGIGGEGFRGLPKAPAKSILSGHRGPVTCVTVHPVYSLLASGSEDATVKIWDYETAQYERTLKGHTQSVTAVAFDGSLPVELIIILNLTLTQPTFVYNLSDRHRKAFGQLLP